MRTFYKITRFILIFYLFLNTGFVYGKTKPITDPWFVGSLIAVSASNRVPGQYSIQPYFQAFKYTKKPKQCVINPTCGIRAGLTNWLDIELGLAAYYAMWNGRQSLQYGDTMLLFGTQICREKYHTYKSNLRLVFFENFPSGKYDKLKPSNEGIDGIGSGAYQSNLALFGSKVVFWDPYHPMNFTWNFVYTFPSRIHVHGFNAYGGGYGTNGHFHAGSKIQGILALEIAFNQNWGYAMDNIFTYNRSSHFNGNYGTNADGTTATFATDYSYVFQITPSIEYNFSANLGVVGGMEVMLFKKNITPYYGFLFTVFYLW